MRPAKCNIQTKHDNLDFRIVVIHNELKSRKLVREKNCFGFNPKQLNDKKIYKIN